MTIVGIVANSYTISRLGASHLTQEEVMEYSQVDFDDDLVLDGGIGNNDRQGNQPEMTDDDSSDHTD